LLLKVITVGRGTRRISHTSTTQKATVPVEQRGLKEGLRRLWHGEQPLWEAFWLYFVAGSFLASILGLLLAAVAHYAVEYFWFGEALGKSGILLLYAPLSVLAPTLYQVFSAVGAWRSASRHHVTGMLARISIFFSLSIALLLIGSVFYVALKGDDLADQFLDESFPINWY
jgi:hypothetical protein